MTTLSDRVEIIESDLEGSYYNPTNCPLARALEREGVPMGVGPDDYLVIDEGTITMGWNELSSMVGQYRYDDGMLFCRANLKTGILVLDSIGGP